MRTTNAEIYFLFEFILMCQTFASVVSIIAVGRTVAIFVLETDNIAELICPET